MVEHFQERNWKERADTTEDKLARQVIIPIDRNFGIGARPAAISVSMTLSGKSYPDSPFTRKRLSSLFQCQCFLSSTGVLEWFN